MVQKSEIVNRCSMRASGQSNEVLKSELSDRKVIVINSHVEEMIIHQVQRTERLTNTDL